MPAADRNPGERVARGIPVLASACPRWWTEGPRAINLDTIDFLDLARGLLAQVYGSHEEGLRLLHIPPELAPEFGFAAVDAADNEELKATWIFHIDSRRVENKNHPPR